MDQDVPERHNPPPRDFSKAVPQFVRDAGGCFTDDREFLHHSAANELRFMKARRVESCDEGRDVVGGLDDIAQVEFFTPRIQAGLRG